MADLGVGIRENIRNYDGRILSAEKAISWATKEGNTTKSDNLPGGLGLKLLCDFIELNDGCIQIVSDAGYWQQKGQNIVKNRLSNPFPGTVVSMEINTVDTHTYGLTSELNAEEIF